MSKRHGHKPTARPGVTPGPPPPPPASPPPLDALTTQLPRIADALTTTAAQAIVKASSAQQTGFALVPTPTDDGESAQCWHFEPGSPCDWDVCRQPERLARGDRGRDPATLAPNRLRQHLPPHPEQQTPSDDGPCTQHPNAPVIGGCCGGCTIYPADMRPASAADEDERCITHFRSACDGTTPDCVFPTPGTGRRRKVRVLLNRLNNGLLLTSDEAQMLTRHVATEIAEHNTTRKRAEQAEELLRVAHETSNRSEAERALVQRDRDQHAAVLREVLDSFARIRTQAGAVIGYQGPSATVDTFEQWSSTVAPTAERPWWQQLAELRTELHEAQGALERVRETCQGVRDRRDPSEMINATQILGLLSPTWSDGNEKAPAPGAALDGTEQPTRETS